MVDALGLDLDRYLRDPSHVPEAAAVQKDRPTAEAELFQPPLFKKHRKDLYGDDQELFVGLADAEQKEWHQKMVCTFELDLPETSRDSFRMKRMPVNFFVNKVRNAEVKWHLLSPEQKKAFEGAKQAEVDQWIKAAAVKRVQGVIPGGRTVHMRWVLTYKDSGAIKGRIVLIGHEDPDLQDLQSSAPTMCRRTRQLVLQLSSRQWRCLKADVNVAFLQGDETESTRSLFAIPVLELSDALKIPH